MIKNSFLETIKALDGEVYNISYHQKRYESVLRSLGSSNYKDLIEYIHPPSTGLYRCRLVYTIDTIEVSYHPYTKKEVHSLKILHDDNIVYSKKSTNRKDIDTLYEKKENCDDILIVKNALVSDTSIANIALYKEGIWYTPALVLLEGTTRQRYIDKGVLIPKDIDVDTLKEYTKVALLNVMIDFDIITNISFK